MRRFFSVVLASFALAACAIVPPAPAYEPPATGVVSAADPRAAEAGAQILRDGGSAADAALATLLALTVVEPQSSGIGGGGFLVYSDRGRDPVTYDGRETAPMAAGPGWFMKDGQPIDFREAVPGGTSVGVPGNLRMMALTHRDEGRLAWSALFQPAIRLARDGFIVSPRLARYLKDYQRTAGFAEAGRQIYYPGGTSVAAGTRLRNPDLAAFLERLAAQGPDTFYVGANAQSVAAAVQTAPNNPAPMTIGDLASYDAKQRPAVCGEYRRHRICGMGPPSSGATTVFAILKQLERFDLAALGAASPTAWHLFAESQRLAYADRERYLADPDFVPVPVAGLTNPAYLARRSTLISPDRTLPVVAAGIPPGAPATADGLSPAEAGTSHFVAVDRWGDVASLTSTIEGPFGSGLVVNGYYLNNELTDFSFVPVVDGKPVANRVEGGKRPRSSMSPTIVFGPDGRVRLAVGAAGGSTIIVQVAKAIIGVVDWGLPADQAIALPLVYSPGDTVYIEEGSRFEAMMPALRALGHKVETRKLPLKANAVELRAGAWAGAADPRSEGKAIAQ